MSLSENGFNAAYPIHAPSTKDSGLVYGILTSYKEKDYYAILQLGAFSTREDVESQYRILSRQVHPDKNHALNAAQAFNALTEAKDSLSTELGFDAAKKKHYHLSNGSSSSSSEPSSQQQQHMHAYSSGGPLHSYYSNGIHSCSDGLFTSGGFFAGMQRPPAISRRTSLHNDTLLITVMQGRCPFAPPPRKYSKK